MGVKNHQKLLVTTGLTALAMFVLSFSSFAKGEYIMGIIGGVLFFAFITVFAYAVYKRIYEKDKET